jgi:hypothetical protein
MYCHWLTLKVLWWAFLQEKTLKILLGVVLQIKRVRGSGPMYWYWLTLKILLWAFLQVKRRRIMFCTGKG